MTHQPEADRLKILYVTPEAVPFASTGGLGEVSGSLPRALAKLGHEVHLVMPLYAQVDRTKHSLKDSGLTLRVELADRVQEAGVFQTDLGICRVHCIACDEFFDRPGLYGTAEGDFSDNAIRFSFFCRAVIELARALDLRADVVHCHDWQTGLLPLYLAAGSPDPGPLASAATVLTIHNLAYQGVFNAAEFRSLGLDESYNHPQWLEYWSKISFLKGGLLGAHGLTTVSQGYAREILTPDHGMGLDGVLGKRADDLTGILNGADYGCWSPNTDPLLPARFWADDLGGKKICRDEMLKTFGLDPVDDHATVLGYVGRLAHQKGVDLILEVLDQIMDRQVRLVILGQGDRDTQQAVLRAAAAYPGRVGVKLEYSDPLAHLLQAGSDILLMPSRFEPCGLNQMHAMRYGTIPVATATGGLRDTVTPFDPATDQGTGFLFDAPQPQQLLEAVQQALQIKSQPAQWSRLMARAMATDFSWHQSAKAYQALFQKIARP